MKIVMIKYLNKLVDGFMEGLGFSLGILFLVLIYKIFLQ